MVLLSSWLILVFDDKLNFNLRANFYPKAYRHKKRLQIPHLHIHLRKEIHLEHSAQNCHDGHYILHYSLEEFNQACDVSPPGRCGYRVNEWSLMFYPCNFKCVFYLLYIFVFFVLTIQSPSSGCSSCLFLCVIWGSNGSQVLQMKRDHTNVTRISDIQPINGQYLIQKAKLGVFLLWVFTSRIRSFFHQKNITLFALGPEKT